MYKGEGYRYLGCCLQGRGIQISRMVSTRERDTDIRYLGWCLQGRGIQISRMVCTRERDTDI